MATIRMPEMIWRATRHHLFSIPGEHFAFCKARWTLSRGEPVFLVCDVVLVPDGELVPGSAGMDLSLAQLLNVVNDAVRTGECLIEIHNHGGTMPRFSATDRRHLPEFVEYALSSLPGRPYAATVWGDETVYGEYFLPGGGSGRIGSVTVIGDQLRQVGSRDDDWESPSGYFDRQIDWFGRDGQKQLGRLRIGVVGCGGTGSQVIQNLVYLGCRDFVLVDADSVKPSNLNRLVTATPADIGTPKVIVAGRLIRSVALDARVAEFRKELRSRETLDALKGVDVIFGCVDNDGARLILNELSLAFRIPYLDVAVGIEASDGSVAIAGGRVVTVLPGGACLLCLRSLDLAEARDVLLPADQQRLNRELGYVAGADVRAPAVVSLNALVGAMGCNEFAALVSGVRGASANIDYDLLGSGRRMKGQWVTPVISRKDATCVQCTLAGLGDEAGIEERYGVREEP